MHLQHRNRVPCRAVDLCAEIRPANVVHVPRRTCTAGVRLRSSAPARPLRRPRRQLRRRPPAVRWLVWGSLGPWAACGCCVGPQLRPAGVDARKGGCSKVSGARLVVQCSGWRHRVGVWGLQARPYSNSNHLPKRLRTSSALAAVGLPTRDLHRARRTAPTTGMLTFP